jgi:hypothetical protein
MGLWIYGDYKYVYGIHSCYITRIIVIIVQQKTAGPRFNSMACEVRSCQKLATTSTELLTRKHKARTARLHITAGGLSRKSDTYPTMQVKNLKFQVSKVLSRPRRTAMSARCARCWASNHTFLGVCYGPIVLTCFNRSCLEMICEKSLKRQVWTGLPQPLLRSPVPCAAGWCRCASRPAKATAEATKPHPNCSKSSLWCGVLLVDCQNVAGGSYPVKDWISAGCFLLPAIITKDERIKLYTHPSFTKKRGRRKSHKTIPPTKFLQNISCQPSDLGCANPLFNTKCVVLNDNVLLWQMEWRSYTLLYSTLLYSTQHFQSRLLRHQAFNKAWCTTISVWHQSPHGSNPCTKWPLRSGSHQNSEWAASGNAQQTTLLPCHQAWSRELCSQ